MWLRASGHPGWLAVLDRAMERTTMKLKRSEIREDRLTLEDVALLEDEAGQVPPGTLSRDGPRKGMRGTIDTRPKGSGAGSK